MSNSHALQAEAPARRIVKRERGLRHGPVTRLMSPGDLGEQLKPFVFLDLFDMSGSAPGNMGLHPHSGIATLTWMTRGCVDYEDTTGKSGVLRKHGVEWMVAGAGVWHGGGWSSPERTSGFQLWVALPPELELGDSLSTYLEPESIPQAGPAKVLLGEYDGVKSRLVAPASMCYLAVELKAGQRWRYQPASGHTVNWIAVMDGALRTPDSVSAGELAIFDESENAIDFYADADTEFVLGSAVRHPHPLVLGRYSVHTSEETLQAGEQRIVQIGRGLQAQGRLRY